MKTMKQPFFGKTLFESIGGINSAKTLTAILSGLIALAVAVPIQAQSMEEIVVTAQRTEESIQDVPIALTALGSDALEERQVITVSDLQLNAPNVSFTNTNFGNNSLAIRGIGRLLTAATGDAGVSIHTNEIAISPNLNTTEYYDMERVEILRGPQGTLYGKNATGGVVNFVTRKPDFGEYNAFVDVEAGNFSHVRVQGAVNIPVGDNFALRFAAMGLERDGYTKNLAAGQTGTDGRVLSTGLFGESLSKEVDGRDQTDFRLTALWQINDDADLMIMYSKYDEDSNRARVTNQICKQNNQPTYGCLDVKGANFETPYNTAKVGATLAALYNILAIDKDVRAAAADSTANYNWARPQVGLRSMHTDFEPVFESEVESWSFIYNHDIGKFSLGVLGGFFESGYFTQQDYFMDVGAELPPNIFRLNPTDWAVPLPARGNAASSIPGNPCNIFDGNAGTDGPAGCFVTGISRDFAFDQSSSEGEGWTAEVKLRSNLDGQFDFLLGFTAFDSESQGDYYVINNVLDHGRPTHYPGYFNNFGHHGGGTFLEGQSLFGEVYYQINDDVKLTVGLRRNDDEKSVRSTGVLWNAEDAGVDDPTGLAVAVGTARATNTVYTPYWSRVPTFVRGADNVMVSNAATNPTGIPAAELALISRYASGLDLAAAVGTAARSDERRAISDLIPIVPGFNEVHSATGSPTSFEFGETTGRIVVDWAINEDMLFYGQLARGYKPGGANPAIPPEFQGDTSFNFDSEEVDSIEFGLKSTLMDGSMILNAALFTYDYTGLQVARIKNNSSINENIDSDVMGLELEMFWQPQAVEGLSVDFNYSWLDTAVDGSESVDPLDRTAGTPGWTVLNGLGRIYIANTAHLETHVDTILAVGTAAGQGVVTAAAGGPTNENSTGGTAVPVMIAQAILAGTNATLRAGDASATIIDYREGLPTNLDGNALPNAPEHQIKLGVGYTWEVSALRGNMTVRWDYYWQDESWGREFNSPGDFIDSWDQHNMSLIYRSSDETWTARLWARNLQDEDNVTGHYVTSDTSGYFRNYFLTEPQIFGLSVRYNFHGR